MASRTDLERLLQLPPKTGRYVTEDGGVVNRANRDLAESFSSDRVMSILGRLFFATPRVNVASSAEQTISLKVSPTKYLIQYQRSATVESAKWDINAYLGGTCIGGTPEQINSSVVGSGINAESTVVVGCTVTGETLIQSLMIPAGSRNSSGIIGSGTGVTAIYPPGTIATLRMSHDAAQSREAQVIFEFSEITQAEYDLIQPILIEV